MSESTALGVPEYKRGSGSESVGVKQWECKSNVARAECGIESAREGSARSFGGGSKRMGAHEGKRWSGDKNGIAIVGVSSMNIQH